MEIGVAGILPGDGIGIDELITRACVATGGRDPLAFASGPERDPHDRDRLRAAGPPYLEPAIAGGYDAFLTGSRSSAS